MKILVVDDDEVNGKMLCKRLNKRNFNTVMLTRGMDCVEYVDAHKDISLILLDIMMPDISGVEVLTILREHYSAFELPIIMVTAKSEVSDVVQALKKGANDYISKPVNIDIAEARVKTQLSLSELYNEHLEMKGVEAVNSMIVTYNHEINNPLTIALGAVRRLEKEQSNEALEKLEEQLNRIAEIVKKIDRITEEGLQTDEYADGRQMVSLK
jgi:DNA-binding response OmpR family regulator